MTWRDDAICVAVMAGALALCAQVESGHAALPVAPASVYTGLLDLFKWTFEGQAYVYTNSTARTARSPLNPGNSTVALPNFTLTADLRPNVKGTSQYLDIVLHPRLTEFYQTGGVADTNALHGYLQEGFLRVKPAGNVTATFGREELTWGPAIFRSPSNPYYFDSFHTDPIKELSGIDVARFVYAVDSYFRVGGGVVLASGHDLVADDRYRDSTFVKADYQGSNYLGSLVLANLRGQAAFVGGYAQATVNDAILLYGEGSTSTSHAGLQVAAPGALPAFSTNLPARREATALAGGSFTFPDGSSIDAEYLYNGFGYDGADLQRFFGQARGARQLALSGGELRGLGDAELGQAASRTLSLLGQHYLYLQLQNNPSQGATLWRLMAAQNLVDHSTQLSYYLEHNMTARLSLISLGIADLGGKSSEFGAIARFSLLLGAKFFLF